MAASGSASASSNTSLPPTTLPWLKDFDHRQKGIHNHGPHRLDARLGKALRLRQAAKQPRPRGDSSLLRSYLTRYRRQEHYKSSGSEQIMNNKKQIKCSRLAEKVSAGLFSYYRRKYFILYIQVIATILQSDLFLHV